MGKSINLESVTNEFDKWRSSKKPKERIPDNLWELVSKIYGHYPRGLICQRLHVSSGQLNGRGFKSKKVSPKKLPSPVPFINVSPATTGLPTATADTSCVEIHRTDGVKLVVKHPDIIQLSALLQQLVK
jgi:hypothetical protein